MNDYFARIHAKTPTRFWINNVTQAEARLAIEAGAENCTQNPSYSWKILNSEDGVEGKAELDQIIRQTADDEEALLLFQLNRIKKIADIFLPLYEQSNGRAGYVTIQASPINETVEEIVKWGLKHSAASPNIMVKVPATLDGIQAIRTLLKEGCPVLATEVMSVAQAVSVCEVYEEAFASSKQVPAGYFAHIAGIFDEELQAQVKAQEIAVDPDALWQAGILVAKKIHRICSTRGHRMKMLSGGARGLHHFTEMVGANSGVTINWGGTAEKLLEQNSVVVDRFSAVPSPDVLDELLEKIPDFKRAYERCGLEAKEYETFPPVVRFRRNFEDAWNKCLTYIAERRSELA